MGIFVFKMRQSRFTIHLDPPESRSIQGQTISMAICVVISVLNKFKWAHVRPNQWRTKSVRPEV